MKTKNLEILSGTAPHIKVGGEFLLGPRLEGARWYMYNAMNYPYTLYELLAGGTYENVQQSPNFRLCQARCLGILLLTILCSQYFDLYIKTNICFL